MESYRLIIYFITYLFEFVMIYVYCHNIFHSRFNKCIEISFGLVLYIILYIILFKNAAWLNVLCFLIFNFGYMFCLFYVKIYVALLHSTILIAAMLIGEVISYCVTMSVTTFFDENAMYNNLLINVLISKLLYALIMYIVLCINRKIKNNKINDKVFLTIIAVPVISIFIMGILMAILMHTYSNPCYNIIIFSVSILMIILNLVIFAIYIYLQRKNDEFSRLQIQLQKERDSTEYYKMLISQNESQSILIHDIKKHLQSIALLNEQKDNEKIAIYIDNITHSSDLQESVKVSDNKFLNAIINRYISECQKKNIDLHTDIRKDTVNFMKEDDITALFCNILDNAYVSASKEKDSFIELIVGKGENTDYTVVTMRNSCSENPFLLHYKKSREGYGLKSVERVATLYGGHMKTYFEEGENIYHTIITLKNSVIF